MKQLILIVLLGIARTTVPAQVSPQPSSNLASSIEVDANLFYQQHMVDSLMKIQLMNELKAAGNNPEKSRHIKEMLDNLGREDSLGKIELGEKIRNLQQFVKGAPVVPFRDTLFYIYTRIASYNSEERSKNIASRIRTIYNDPFFRVDSIYVTQTESGTEINYKRNLVIMVVTKIDALYYNKDDYSLAVQFQRAIRKNLQDELRSHSLARKLIRAVKTALVMLVFGLFVFLVNMAFRRIRKSITAHSVYRNGFTFKNIKLLSPEDTHTILLKGSRVMQILLVLLAIYITISVIFSIFNQTKSWTGTLFQWILNPVRNAGTNMISFLPELFTILVIFLIFKYVIRGMQYFVDQIDKGEINIQGFHADWAHPTFRIVKILLYAFMFVLIFPYLPGSDSPAFRGVSVFIGILISLGSSSAVANIIAGMVITYMRPFRIGDRVKIGEITGDVVEKTFLVTRLKTMKNEDVTVPNSTVLLGSTINYSAHTVPGKDGLIIHTTVTIGYDAPWKDVHAALIEAATRCDMILKNPAPFVLQTSLDDFYVSYQINGYTREANRMSEVYSQLHAHIQDCFNEHGIEIMSPHYRAERDGNEITIPKTYGESRDL
jgi:small-conductance mechanosensitive channel